MQPAVGPWRAVRAALVAAVCVTCSLVAHVAAGGVAPGPAFVAGCAAAVAVVAYLLSGTRWTFGRLLLVLGGGQLVFHPVFDAAAGGTAAETSVMAVAHLAAAVALAAGMARGDLVLWRVAAVVEALLRPLAGVAQVVPSTPRPAVAAVPVREFLDLPVPTGVDLTPSAERSPPSRSC